MTNKGMPTTQRPRSRANSMLSVWYGFLVGVLQGYLIIQSVRKFVWFAELSWPYKQTPFIELNAYIVLTGVAVLMLPFFLAASFLQVGNAANDNRLLGKHLNSRDEWATFLLPSMLYQGTEGFFRSIWTHSGPTASFIHLISSFCLLLPQTIMEAVLLKFEYLPQDTLWRSDLEFVMPQGERNALLKILTEEDSVTRKDMVEGSLMDHGPGVLRIEYFNYALAMLMFSLRYANVFWHTNKTFAILFSVQLMTNSLLSLISFSSFSLMYKLHVLGPSKILPTSLPFLLNHHVTLLLYIISVTILFVSSSVLYHYGYLKIASFVREKARTQFASDGRERYGLGWAYFPHCSALAVLLALAATQSPLVHDATLIYRITLDNCMLTYVVSTAAHLLLWILLWFALTTKSNWKFNVNINVGRLRVKELDSLRLAAEISLGNPSDLGEPATPLSSSMLVVNDGQAFAVSDLNSKRNILEVLLQNSELKREEDSDERIYWPTSCSVTGTQNSLEEEKQPWMKDTKEASRSSGRNKVTFYDEISSPNHKYASVPVTRLGGYKRKFRDQSYNEVNQLEDEGDYALLRRGKSCIRNQNIGTPDESEACIKYQEMIPGNQLNASLMGAQGMNAPLSVIRQDASIAQTTPRSVLSTDSGYQGLTDGGRTDSRSTASSGSPPDRTANSDSSGTHSAYADTTKSPCHPSLDDCYCETQQCFLNHSTHRKVGLMRKESIQSPVHPIYEPQSHGKSPYSIYESQSQTCSASQPMENPNGENPVRRKSVCQNESSMLVSSALESPPYHPSSQYSNNNINTANELQERQATELNQSLYGETSGRIVRKSSTRRLKTSEASPIQQTAYGRCTNMKLSSFADQSMPPIPPPLPPLSFLSNTCMSTGLSPVTAIGTTESPIPITLSPPNQSSNYNYCSDRYITRHSTIPNHVSNPCPYTSPRENSSNLHSPHSFRTGHVM